MAHVIPTLRAVTRLTYTPPAMRRKTGTSETTGDPPGSTDFRAILNSSNKPASGDAATAPASASIPTVTSNSPGVVVTPTTTTITPSATTENPPSSANLLALFNTNSQPVKAPAGTTTTSASAATVTSSAPVLVVAPPAATPCPMAPTTESLFGANPWCTDAGGTGPSCSYSYNPMYFATPATAAKVAQMLGGKVVAMNAITPFGPFQQNQPNLMVQMPDGKLINAGLVAGFYSHGYPQQMVDKMIAAEVSGDLLCA